MSFDLSSSIEDYLEAILLLSEKDDAVRVTDIAEKLDIAKPSVTAAVNTLKEKGLVVQERYGKVFLTPEGRAYALKVKRRHKALRNFLVHVLGVSEQTAEKMHASWNMQSALRLWRNLLTSWKTVCIWILRIQVVRRLKFRLCYRFPWLKIS